MRSFEIPTHYRSHLIGRLKAWRKAQVLVLTRTGSYKRVFDRPEAMRIQIRCRAARYLRVQHTSLFLKSPRRFPGIQTDSWDAKFL